MSESNESKYLVFSFMEGLVEPLVDLLIEILYLANNLSFTVINRAMQQLAPSSQYTPQFTTLSVLLVVIPLLLIIIFAYFRPLIDLLDALVYTIGLSIGIIIFIEVNNAGLFSNIIGIVTSNMLLILASIILGFATRIGILLSKQERDYW
jgi:predicted benzoate:H+ symporter BenE